MKCKKHGVNHYYVLKKLYDLNSGIVDTVQRKWKTKSVIIKVLLLFLIPVMQISYSSVFLIINYFIILYKLFIRRLRQLTGGTDDELGYIDKQENFINFIDRYMFIFADAIGKKEKEKEGGEKTEENKSCMGSKSDEDGKDTFTKRFSIMGAIIFGWLIFDALFMPFLFNIINSATGNAVGEMGIDDFDSNDFFPLTRWIIHKISEEGDDGLASWHNGLYNAGGNDPSSFINFTRLYPNPKNTRTGATDIINGLITFFLVQIIVIVYNNLLCDNFGVGEKEIDYYIKYNFIKEWFGKIMYVLMALAAITPLALGIVKIIPLTLGFIITTLFLLLSFEKLSSPINLVISKLIIPFKLLYFINLYPLNILLIIGYLLPMLKDFFIMFLTLNLSNAFNVIWLVFKVTGLRMLSPLTNSIENAFNALKIFAANLNFVFILTMGLLSVIVYFLWSILTDTSAEAKQDGYEDIKGDKFIKTSKIFNLFGVNEKSDEENIGNIGNKFYLSVFVTFLSITLVSFYKIFKGKKCPLGSKDN